MRGIRVSAMPCCPTQKNPHHKDSRNSHAGRQREARLSPERSGARRERRWLCREELRCSAAWLGCQRLGLAPTGRANLKVAFEDRPVGFVHRPVGVSPQLGRGKMELFLPWRKRNECFHQPVANHSQVLSPVHKFKAIVASGHVALPARLLVRVHLPLTEFLSLLLREMLLLSVHRFLQYSKP